MSGDQPADIRKQESELYLQPGQLLRTGKTVLDAVHIRREILLDHQCSMMS